MIKVLLVTEESIRTTRNVINTTHIPTGGEYFSSLINTARATGGKKVEFHLTLDSSPENIIRLYRENRIDIVAIILNSGESVLRLIKSIKSCRKGRNIPIIAGSIEFYYNSAPRVLALREGADYSFSTCVSNGEILTIIKTVARRCRRRLRLF
jgi:hypothetical protein